MANGSSMVPPEDVPGPALVSVLIPCRGAAEGLAAAIDSVLAQSYRAYEVLVCGGCLAGDASYPPAANVRPALGHAVTGAAALDRGLGSCEGTAVVVLDVTDRLLPDALAVGVAALEAHPECAIAFGRHRVLSNDGAVQSGWQPVGRIPGDHYLALIRGDYPVAVSAGFMYRRNALELVGVGDSSLEPSLHLDLCARILRHRPAHFHGVPVAERLHDPARRDPVSQFTSSARVLRAQRDDLAADRRVTRAYRTGMVRLAQRHGLELFEEVRVSVRSQRWGKAAGAGRALARYLLAVLRHYPRALPAVAGACLLPPATARSSTLRQLDACVVRAARRPSSSSLHQIRESVRTLVPASAVLAVAQETDEDDLELEGREVRPFSLVQSAALPPLLERLEELRTEGADFLLVPHMAFWWLEHYCPELHSFLDASFRRLWADEHCLIYQLEGSASPSSRALVTGFFSFGRGAATAGDVLARDVVCQWLDEAGLAYDVAVAPPFVGGVNWRRVDPDRYSHVVFVCGPYLDNRGQRALFRRFEGRRLIGLNLSMPVGDGAHPFDVLIERDHRVGGRPDITLCSRPPRVPVVGVCLREHAEGTREAHAAVRRLVESAEMAVVDIDTRLDANTTGLRSAAEVESLLARMDVVVTTRLHGMVLSLKHGVPVVAIDPEVGGHKIRQQAETLGWPIVLTVDALSDEALVDSLAFCLTDEARTRARECAEGGLADLGQVRQSFMAQLQA